MHVGSAFMHMHWVCAIGGGSGVKVLAFKLELVGVSLHCSF